MVETQHLAALRGIFDEIIAKHVADRHVRIFDPAVVFRIDHDDFVGDFGELAFFPANQRDGCQAVVFGPLNGFDQVR